jgi:hypothetical protein
LAGANRPFYAIPAGNAAQFGEVGTLFLVAEASQERHRSSHTTLQRTKLDFLLAAMNRGMMPRHTSFESYHHTGRAIEAGQMWNLLSHHGAWNVLKCEA